MGLAQFIVNHFDRSLSSPSQLTKLGEGGEREALSHIEIGELGEKLAQTWLIRRGWKVLWKNFRAKRGGEVDIVCRDSDTLVFVEVKARTNVEWARPSDAVDQHKQKLIARGATAWLQRMDVAIPAFRFDILEVILKEGEVPKLNLVENAFQLPKSVKIL